MLNGEILSSRSMYGFFDYLGNLGVSFLASRIAEFRA